MFLNNENKRLFNVYKHRFTTKMYRSFRQEQIKYKNSVFFLRLNPHYLFWSKLLDESYLGTTFLEMNYSWDIKLYVYDDAASEFSFLELSFPCTLSLKTAIATAILSKVTLIKRKL